MFCYFLFIVLNPAPCCYTSINSMYTDVNVNNGFAIANVLIVSQANKYILVHSPNTPSELFVNSFLHSIAPCMIVAAWLEIIYVQHSAFFVVRSDSRATGYLSPPCHVSWHRQVTAIGHYEFFISKWAMRLAIPVARQIPEIESIVSWEVDIVHPDLLGQRERSPRPSSRNTGAYS